MTEKIQTFKSNMKDRMSVSNTQEIQIENLLEHNKKLNMFFLFDHSLLIFNHF